MFAQTVRLLLGPVLLMQGRAVRRDILRLPEPDGPRSGITGKGDGLKLLIFGDSSAAGVGCAQQSEALAGCLVGHLSTHFVVDWTLHARTGWTTREAEAELSALDGQSFDIAICCLGVNDITTETGIGPWLESYHRVCEHLRVRLCVSHIFVSGLPPMGRFPALPQPLRWYMGMQKARHEAALARWSGERPSVTRVPIDLDMQTSDMAGDGFHPGPRVYAAWSGILADEVVAWSRTRHRSAERAVQ